VAGLGTQHADAQDPGARHGGGAAQGLTARRAALAALALAGFAVTIAAYHPGLVTTDSIAQYEQAVAGVYTDAHPPLMAWLWSRLIHVVPGAAGMLWLHAAMLWLALFLFADGAAVRGARHTWLVVAVGFLPPILGTAGEIWKDVGMAAALALGAAIAYRASARGGRIGRVAALCALVPLFYATAVRANAPAATGPVLVYWAMCAWPRASLRRACGIAVGMLAVLLVMQWGFERAIDAKRMHFGQVLETFDIAALACGGDARPTPAIPPIFYQQGSDAASLCRAFDAKRVDPLYSSPSAPLRFDTDRSGLRALGSAWRQALLDHPIAYLVHRATVFTAFLGFGVNDGSRTIWAPFSVANPYGLDYRYNAIAAAIGTGVGVAAALGLYNGTPWILLAAVVLVVTLRRRSHMPMEAALAASALAYAAAYFVVGIAPDYRYLYWTVVASAVAGVLALLPSRRFIAFAEHGARMRRRALDVAARHRAAFAAMATAALGFAVTIAAFYPGLMTVDSIYQYDQAVGRKVVTDHHPPVMVWLWRGLAQLAPGPAPMLVLHAAMMWTALAAIAIAATRRGVRHAWLVPLAGFTPMFLGIEGAIWKDVGMAAAFLLATAMFYAGRPRTTGEIRAVASALPLFYGTMVRANAPAGALPLFVYAARRVRMRGRLVASLALGTAALVGCLALQWTVGRTLGVERAHFTQYIETFDLAGIQCSGGDAPIPLAFMRTVPGALPVCKVFDPIQVDFLFSGGPPTPLWATNDPAALRELRAAWWRAVIGNPGVYLAHRARVFNAMMGAGVSIERRTLALNDSLGGARGFPFVPNRLSAAIATTAYAAAEFHFFNGYAWLAIAAVVMVVTMRRLRAGRGDDTDEVSLALAASAIAYTLPYFFVGVAPDFRYIYWTIVATLVAAILVALPRATRVAVSR
jgi:hypothetical protein